jgi:hypothetical protein
MQIQISWELAFDNDSTAALSSSVILRVLPTDLFTWSWIHSQEIPQFGMGSCRAYLILAGNMLFTQRTILR